MKRVLFVDDDEDFLSNIKEYFEKDKELECLFAHDGLQALKIIEEKHPSLMVLDLKMPVMDGAKLLAELFNRKIWLPVIVVTAYGLSMAKQEIEKYGIAGYLEKPLSLSELHYRTRELLNDERQDQIEGFSILTLIQSIELEGKTGVLEIKGNEGFWGKIFFRNGKVLDAEHGDISGLEALARLLAIENPKVKIIYINHNKKDFLKGTNIGNLMQALKIADELKENKKKNKKKEEKMGKLEELQELQNSLADELPYFKACAVVSVDDGLPLAGVSADTSYDVSVPSGAFADAFKSVVKAYEYSQWGPMDEFLATGPETIVLVIGLKGGKFYQGISVGSKATLGMVRVIYSKYKDKIEALL